MRVAGDRQVFHTYAIWDGWAFDHSGWNPEPQLLAVNTDFEGHPLERVKTTGSLAEFCEKHRCRMPNQYWHDRSPRSRLREPTHRTLGVAPPAHNRGRSRCSLADRW